MAVTVSSGASSQNQIGEGAFSIVLKVKDISSKQVYAMKKMLLQSPEDVSMATNELEALRRFRHNHIIMLIDSQDIIENNIRTVYLLMPYYRRGNLRDVLNMTLNGAVNRPTIAQVLQHFSIICEAVQVLHRYQPSYVHQDIKPENILIDDAGLPILTDFGSVRKAVVKLETRADILKISDEAAQFCTASYRAPELYDPQKGMTLDTRTDIWALGCLLYALWFGYSPFESQFVGDKIKVVPCSVLRVLSRISWKASPSADDQLILDICEWILEKELDKRPFVDEVLDRVHNAAPLRSRNSFGNIV